MNRLETWSEISTGSLNGALSNNTPISMPVIESTRRHKEVVEVKSEKSVIFIFSRLEEYLKNFRLNCLDQVESIELEIGGSRIDKIYGDFFPYLHKYYSKLQSCDKCGTEERLFTKRYDRGKNCTGCHVIKLKEQQRKNLELFLDHNCKDVCSIITQYSTEIPSEIVDQDSLIPMYLLNVVGIYVCALQWHEVRLHIKLKPDSELKEVELTYDSSMLTKESQAQIPQATFDNHTYFNFDQFILQLQYTGPEQIVTDGFLCPRIRLGFNHVTYQIAVMIKGRSGTPIVYDGHMTLCLNNHNIKLKPSNIANGFHVYSLTTDPEDVQKGINLSRIDTINIAFDSLERGVYDIDVMAINSNLLGYRGGMSGLLYSS